MNKILLFCSIASLFIHTNEVFPDTNQKLGSDKKIERINILSIDGGGIRGIIPAMILADLEKRLENGKTIADCFHIVSGTSSGGLIAMLLSIPDKNNKPKYSAAEIVEFYKQFGKHVFQKSLWQSLKSGFGFIGAKYSEKPLEEILETYFSEEELKNTLTNVLVPSYEIDHDKNYFFRSNKARNNPERNYKLKDIGRAITAAPTYFSPAVIKDTSGIASHSFIDGGISVNNPSVSAVVYGVELYGKDRDFLILSLGAGTNEGAGSSKINPKRIKSSGLLGWGLEIIELMMYAVNDVTDRQMRDIFNNNHPHKDYYRMQIILEPKNSSLDNISESNIEVLVQKAQLLININDKYLQEIADSLNKK